MLLHYLGKFKIGNLALFIYVNVSNVSLYHLYNRCMDVSNVMKISAKINTVQNINILLFSFSVLNKLKPIVLSDVGLSTIKR